MEDMETNPILKTLKQIVFAIEALSFGIGFFATCLDYFLHGTQPSNMLMLGLILLAIDLKLKK
jgi:hypothetical protein